MFCPKCGAILLPKKDGSKTKLACSCGFSSTKLKPEGIKEKMKDSAKVDVVENDDIDTLPITKAECPKCKCPEAYYWLVQTRAGDEPETKFLKCKKCKHTWRDYS